ncbi:FHA domain-containing protein [Lysobacter sp. F60174L2]|uniref:FHA domain-containing protein n=1 Tax=Lysobacter sp. F60174L2 TaxID=3459295 RepID=UPI00403DC189
MKLVFPGGEHPQVLLGQGINRVGTDPHANIVIDRPGVQLQHCQLHVTGQMVMLSAAAGVEVSVNGRKVDGVMALRAGDSVAFGKVQAHLAALDPSVALRQRSMSSRWTAAGMANAAANDDPGVTAVRAVLPKFVLRGMSGSVAGRSFPLLGPVSIGRVAECELHLHDEGLSRRHARLVPVDTGIQVEDLGSSNGCYINGERVLRGVARAGDEIAFDDVRFRLATPAAVEPIQVHAVPGNRPARRPSWNGVSPRNWAAPVGVVRAVSPWAWTGLAAVGLVTLVAQAFLS